MNKLICSLIAAVGFGTLPVNIAEASVAKSDCASDAATRAAAHRQLTRRHHRHHHHHHHHHHRHLRF